MGVQPFGMRKLARKERKKKKQKNLSSSPYHVFGLIDMMSNE